MHASGTFPLPKAKYGVAISYDPPNGRNLDIDLQAVIIDDRGQIIDAVYYNNLKACKCVTHSGDELTGEKSGFDEVIWVTLSRLPENVKLLSFIVAAHSGGHLRDAKNGMIHVLEETKANEVASFAIENTSKDVDVVAMMVKSDSSRWHLNIVEEPAQAGKHFIDILEPTLGNLVRQVIPGAPKRLKVAFAMEKGTVVDLPMSSEIRSITAGLGWDTDNGDVDLDVSAVLFDADGRDRDAVFFGNLDGHGLQHSGDNLTGEGDGDDETISVDLLQVPNWCQHIYFCVNIYSRGFTFAAVANPYCRILDAGGDELARYELREAGRENGLLIARLFREDGGGRWGFQAIGTFCRGQTWKDSVGEMRKLAHVQPRALQMQRGSTCISVSPQGNATVVFPSPGGAGTPTASFPGHAATMSAPPPPKSKTCVLL